MNCREGDIAISVGPTNPGCLFIVLTWVLDYWEVEPMQSVFDKYTGERLPPGTIGFIPDRYLRPIRDQPGEDETLTWAGKPKEIALT